MRAIGAVVLVGAFLLTAGCGGSDGGGKGGDARPSAAEVAKALESLEESDSGVPVYTDAQAECIAGVLAGSDLSTKSLSGIVEDPAGFSPKGTEAEVFSRIAAKISTCLVDELASPPAAP